MDFVSGPLFSSVAHCSLFQAEADFEDASSRLKVWKKCGWEVRQTHLRVDFLHARAMKFVRVDSLPGDPTDSEVDDVYFFQSGALQRYQLPGGRILPMYINSVAPMTDQKWLQGWSSITRRNALWHHLGVSQPLHLNAGDMHAWHTVQAAVVK